MWELTIVGLVAVVALGMLVGFATLPADGEQPSRGARPRGRGRRCAARALRTAAVARGARGDHVRDGADARAGAPGGQPGGGRARRRRPRRVDSAEDARSLRAVGVLALPAARAGRGAGGRPAPREPPHQGRARARQPRLEHLAGSGAHPDQGWFHTCRAPQPQARRGAQPHSPSCSRTCAARLATEPRGRRRPVNPGMLTLLRRARAARRSRGGARAAAPPRCGAGRSSPGVQDFDFTQTHFDRIEGGGRGRREDRRSVARRGARPRRRRPSTPRTRTTRPTTGSRSTARCAPRLRPG